MYYISNHTPPVYPSIHPSLCLTFTSVDVRGGVEGVRVPPGRGALQVVCGQSEALRRQLEAREAEVGHLRQGEAPGSLQGRPMGHQRRRRGRRLRLAGRFAFAVEQVLDKEGRVLGRSLLRGLGHGGGGSLFVSLSFVLLLFFVFFALLGGEMKLERRKSAEGQRERERAQA